MAFTIKTQSSKTIKLTPDKINQLLNQMRVDSDEVGIVDKVLMFNTKTGEFKTGDYTGNVINFEIDDEECEIIVYIGSKEFFTQKDKEEFIANLVAQISCEVEVIPNEDNYYENIR